MPSAKKVAAQTGAKKKAAPVKKAVSVKKVAKKPTKKVAPAKPVKKSIPAKPVKKAAKKVAPAKPVKKSVPAKPVKKSVPAKPVKKAAKKVAPAKPVKKSVPAKPVKKVAKKPTKKVVPAKPVKKSIPAKPSKPAVPAPVKKAEPKPVVAPTPAVPAEPARLVMLPAVRPTKRKSGPSLKPLRNIPTPLVISEGDEPWARAELEAIRKDLLQDLGRLRQELASAEVEIADLLKDSGDGAGDDQADAGTKTFEREHELSLVNNARDMVLQSERALARIELGTYGVCESCGHPIGKARLQVFPRATLCMVCKQREERR